MAPLKDFLKDPFGSTKRRLASAEEEHARKDKANAEANAAERAESKAGHRNDEWDFQHREYRSGGLPVVVDHGPPNPGAAVGDGIYWNSVLVEGDEPLRGARRAPGDPGYEIVSWGDWVREGKGGYGGDYEEHVEHKTPENYGQRSWKGKETAREQMELTQRQSVAAKPLGRRHRTERFAAPDVPYTESPASLDSGYNSHVHRFIDSASSSLMHGSLNVRRQPGEEAFIHCDHSFKSLNAQSSGDADSNRDFYDVSPRSSPMPDLRHYAEQVAERERLVAPSRSVSTASSDGGNLPPSRTTVPTYDAPGQRGSVLPQIHLPARGKPRQSPPRKTPTESSLYQQHRDPSIATGPISPIFPPRRAPHPCRRSFSSTSHAEERNFTWNETLNMIVSNEAVDPIMRTAVRDRARESGTANGHGQGSAISAIDIGLVPNFSYPVQAAYWHDKWLADGLLRGGDGEEDGSEEDDGRLADVRSATLELRSGAAGAAPSDSSKGPSGRPEHAQEVWTIKDDLPGVEKQIFNGVSHSDSPPLSLLRGSPSPSRHSPTTVFHPQDRTISMRSKALKRLTRKIDRLIGEKNFYKAHLTSHVEAWGACEEHVKQLEREKEALIEENELLRQEHDALWNTLQFSKGLLKMSFERENSVLNMLWNFKNRQEKRENAFADRFLLKTLMPKIGFSLRLRGKGQRSAAVTQSRDNVIETDDEATPQPSTVRCSSMTTSLASDFSRQPSTATATATKASSTRQLNHDDPRIQGFYTSATSLAASSTRSGTTQTMHDDANETSRFNMRKIRFPTVMQEIDALVEFADIHMRRLVEDIQDLGVREEDYWAVREKRQKDVDAEDVGVEGRGS